MNKRVFLPLILFLTHIHAEPVAKNYGGQSMIGTLKNVLVRKPDASFGEADPKKWHYTAKPSLELARAEHDQFVGILKQEGVEVTYHDVPLTDHADAIFVHDPILITDHGAIVLKMGKNLRNGEEAAIRQKVESLGIPILYELSGEASAEGGDMLWLDEKTLVIGRGFRTNQDGIDQIRTALTPFGIDVMQFDLPYDQGKEACLHLQSLISLVDDKKAVVYLRDMPVAFVNLLKERGFQLLEVPEDEYPTMGPNILAIKPGVVLTIEGNPKTKKLLEQAGCKVYTYKGNEISKKAEGGATCLTRPILRESV